MAALGTETATRTGEQATECCHQTRLVNQTEGDTESLSPRTTGNEMKVTKTGVTLDRVDNPQASTFGVEFDVDEDGKVIEDSVRYPEDGDSIELKFAEPGARVEHKVIFTVKAINPHGVIVQLPLENQINNHVASPDDFVGLRFYTRKGFVLLWDFENARGVFCPTRDCHAAWNDEFSGTCSPEHEAITVPKQTPGRFSDGATTSRSWLRR